MIDNQGRLHIQAKRVSKPCEECGSTNYPNLETNLVGIRVVLCRSCLQKEVDRVNKALKETNEEKQP